MVFRGYRGFSLLAMTHDSRLRLADEVAILAEQVGKGPRSRPSSRLDKPATSVPVEVRGHRIEVRGVAGEDESLWIDGERRQFFVSSGGYHLLDDAYRPGEKTLLEAARKHLDRQADRAG
jgi:hypothetical protein